MNTEFNRRDCLKLALTGAATSLIGSAYGNPASTAKLGKAEHCIFFWLGGGMAQVDTFDPKRLGDARSKPSRSGSYYASVDTAVPGVQVTEHLSQTAKVMDRVTAIRTVNHRVVDEHAFATNLVHTGRMISGSTVYPSVGSIVTHQRGAVDQAQAPAKGNLGKVRQEEKPSAGADKGHLVEFSGKQVEGHRGPSSIRHHRRNSGQES